MVARVVEVSSVDVEPGSSGDPKTVRETCAVMAGTVDAMSVVEMLRAAASVLSSIVV